MLETTVIGRNGRKRTRRLFLLPVSISLHVVLITGAVVAAVWDVDLPGNAPSQISTFRSVMELPVPPPAPPLSRRSTPEQQTPREQPQEVVVPVEVPETTPQVEKTGTEMGSELGSPVGDPQGDPSGVPQGVPGGWSERPQVEERPYPVGRDVKAPVIVRRVEPRYPEHARKSRLEGSVVVQCVVDRTGAIRDLAVVGSSHPIFEPSTLEAMRQWRFRGGSLNGRPVDTVFLLTVKFQLD